MVFHKVTDRPPAYFETSSWSEILEETCKWGEILKQEVGTPDLWAANRRQREFLSGAGYETVDNTPFTAAEQAEITAQLREIKGYVKKTLSLSDEQMALVEARFDEAERASDHIGRKDWLLLFMGILFTLIITGVIPPNVVQHVIEMAIHGLSHLFGEGGKAVKLPAIS